MMRTFRHRLIAAGRRLKGADEPTVVSATDTVPTRPSRLRLASSAGDAGRVADGQPPRGVIAPMTGTSGLGRSGLDSMAAALRPCLRQSKTPAV